MNKFENLTFLYEIWLARKQNRKCLALQESEYREGGTLDYFKSQCELADYYEQLAKQEYEQFRDENFDDREKKQWETVRQKIDYLKTVYKPSSKPPKPSP